MKASLENATKVRDVKKALAGALEVDESGLRAEVHKWTAYDLTEGDYLLVTLHRPSLPYHSFLSLEAGAAAVLTGSGGIQEETAVLGVPCFTLRDNTERAVTITDGTNELLGLDPARIAEIPERLGRAREPRTPPLWDGGAGERAAAVLEGQLED